MATYRIMEESNGQIKATGLESSRKREIEVMFNRFMRGWKKDSRCIVEDVRIGYSIVEFFGTWGGRITTEYWIAKN